MLSLYENDYKNSILQNTYLILGNLVEGSLDATRFGFVNKGDILGKVVYWNRDPERPSSFSKKGCPKGDSARAKRAPIWELFSI